jgi:serine/threonine protein kinase
LDNFWKENIGRERLSSVQRRIKIALELFTAIRFLHEGSISEGIVACFHRDIKSANICLTRDLTAQLIDCGLAKFVQDGETRTSASTSKKGTPGYTCPEYESGELPIYVAACDVFSFGVVMAELWTGKLQNSGATGNKKVNKKVNFHKKYAVKEEPMYEDLDPALDIDQSLDPLLPKFLRDFADLSIACMAADSDDRPAGDDILKKLHTIWTQSTMDEEERDNDEELEPWITKCRSCKNEDVKCQLTKEGYYLCSQYCWRSDCATKWSLAQYARQSQNNHDRLIENFRFQNCKFDEFREETAKKHGKLDAVLSSLAKLESKVIHPIPRLFVIVPRQAGEGLLNWLSSTTAQHLHLYFVCAHSHQAVSEPIKLKVTKDWVKKVAPALVLSLKILSLVGKTISGLFPDSGGLVGNVLDSKTELSFHQIKAMEIEATNMIQDDTTIVQRIHSGKLNSNDVKVLNDDALQLIAEKAMDNRQWRDEMVQVRLKSSTATLWVMKNCSKKDEYELIIA